MTVAELIEALKAMPQDQEVRVYDLAHEQYTTPSSVDREHAHVTIDVF